MYADLEESLGTVESTKAIYNRIIDLKIATPQIIINYALFLEENHYFEEAFKVLVTHRICCISLVPRLSFSFSGGRGKESLVYPLSAHPRKLPRFG